MLPDLTPIITAVLGTASGAGLTRFLNERSAKKKRDAENAEAVAKAEVERDVAAKVAESIDNALAKFELKLVTRLNGTYVRPEWIKPILDATNQRLDRLEQSVESIREEL